MCMTVDNLGNIYFGDNGNNRIRKISNATGIVTTVVGGGSSSFDGVPATTVALGSANPGAIYVDRAGNLYFIQSSSLRVMDPLTGLVNTIMKSLSNLGGITGDTSGNIYVSDKDHNGIVEVYGLSHISKTIAGKSRSGYSGDGGLASAALLNSPEGITCDGAGNIFFGDGAGAYIRRIDAATGIISTVAGCAGCGIAGYITSPVLCTSIQTSATQLFMDVFGSLYYSTNSGWVDKIAGIGVPGIITANFSVTANQRCNGPEIMVKTAHYDTGRSVKTNFGDGFTDSSIVLPQFISGGYLFLSHAYSTSGTYIVTHVLYNGSIPTDTLTYSYNYKFCRTLPLKYYYEGNGNCTKDNFENYVSVPGSTEVSLNGIPVDTLSATSGFAYDAYGSVGSVYSFRFIPVPGGLTAICPSSGTIQDTILSTVPLYPDKYIGVSCPATSGRFDFSINAVVPVNGAVDQMGRIYVSNSPYAANI
jgi:hypothetical protein